MIEKRKPTGENGVHIFPKDNGGLFVKITVAMVMHGPILPMIKPAVMHTGGGRKGLQVFAIITSFYVLLRHSGMERILSSRNAFSD